MQFLQFASCPPTSFRPFLFLQCTLKSHMQKRVGQCAVSVVFIYRFAQLHDQLAQERSKKKTRPWREWAIPVCGVPCRACNKFAARLGSGIAALNAHVFDTCYLHSTRLPYRNLPNSLLPPSRRVHIVVTLGVASTSWQRSTRGWLTLDT